MKKLILFFLVSAILIACTNQENKKNVSSNKNEKQKIKIGTLEYAQSEDFEVTNFSLSNSFIKESVTHDGKNEFYVIFTYDLTNKSKEDVFEKRLTPEKAAKELGMTKEEFLIEIKYQSDNFEVTPRIQFADINNIPGKEEARILISMLYDDNKNIIDFNSMNSFKKGSTIHGTGVIKFSTLIRATDDLNIAFIENEIKFKPNFFIEIDGGTASDFGKYHSVIAQGNIDISNIKNFGAESLKSKKNFISMGSSLWYKMDSEIVKNLLKLKKS